MYRERSYSLFESYLKIIFVVGGIVVASFFLFSYFLHSPLRSKAAVGPDGAQITFEDIASGSTATTKKIGVTIKPVTASYKITAFNLVLNLSGNAKIASITAPANFPDELFNKPADPSPRFAYTVGSTGQAQDLVYFELNVEQNGTGDTGQITVDTTKSEVVGTVPQIAFGLDTSPVSHTFSWSGAAISSTPGTGTASPTTVPNGASPTSPPTAGLTTMSLQVAVRLQGILSRPSQSAPETFALGLRGPTDLDTKVGLTPDDKGIYRGAVSVQAKPGTTYRLYLKGPRHLQKKICVNSPTESAIGSYRCDQGSVTLNAGGNDFDLTNITLLVGDLPAQDGVVDSYDTSYIRQSLGSRDPSRLVVGDLNRDGIVDTQDMSLVIQSLNIKYDEQ